MNAYQAEINAKQLIREGLIAAGCLDGVTLSNAQVSSATKPLIWLQRPSEKGGEKQTYVTFETVSTSESDANSRADNQVIAWSYEGNIDLFTTLALNNTTIISLLGNIVTELEKKGFNVTMDSDLYEYDTKIYHKPISINKEIY